MVHRGGGGGGGYGLSSESLSALRLGPPRLSGAPGGRLGILALGLTRVRGPDLIPRGRPSLLEGLKGGRSLPYSLADLSVAGLAWLLLPKQHSVTSQGRQMGSSKVFMPIQINKGIMDDLFKIE